MLTRIAGNKALRNPALLERLPQSIVALEALAALDARLIEEGVSSGTIHCRLTEEAAKAVVRQHRAEQAKVAGQNSIHASI